MISTLAFEPGFIEDMVLFFAMSLDDPHDDCTHWLPHLSDLGHFTCSHCGEFNLPCAIEDRHMPGVCNDCASDWRWVHEYTGCCHVEAKMEQGVVYCPACGVET